MLRHQEAPIGALALDAACRPAVDPELVPAHTEADYVERNKAAWERWAPGYVIAGRRAWQTDELRWGLGALRSLNFDSSRGSSQMTMQSSLDQAQPRSQHGSPVAGCVQSRLISPELSS